MSRKKLKLLNQNGYSLIEILVAVLMFSIMILAIFRIFAFSTIQNKKTNDLNELYSIAQRSMEYFKNNNVVIENENYQELTGYTVDQDTLNRFMVIYKAEKIDIENPQGEVDISNTIPNKVVNYNVTIEVYFKKHKSKLGNLDENSKISIAKSQTLPIVSLNSQITQYEK